MRTKGGCLKEESQKGASFISDSGELPSGVLFKPRSHTAYSKPLLKPPHLLGGKTNFKPHFLRFCNEIRFEKHRFLKTIYTSHNYFFKNRIEAKCFFRGNRNINHICFLRSAGLMLVEKHQVFHASSNIMKTTVPITHPNLEALWKLSKCEVNYLYRTTMAEETLLTSSKYLEYYTVVQIYLRNIISSLLISVT